MPHPEPERREHAPPGISLLAGFTPEQAQAVTHGAGPLRLIAGPGAGKTRTLTHRIANQSPPQSREHALCWSDYCWGARLETRRPAEVELPSRRGTATSTLGLIEMSPAPDP